MLIGSGWKELVSARRQIFFFGFGFDYGYRRFREHGKQEGDWKMGVAVVGVGFGLKAVIVLN